MQGEIERDWVRLGEVMGDRGGGEGGSSSRSSHVCDCGSVCAKLATSAAPKATKGICTLSSSVPAAGSRAWSGSGLGLEFGVWTGVGVGVRARVSGRIGVGVMG